jgi:two-component system CheB/CheR fusion protein
MKRQKQHATAALLFLDLDHFKEINDVYGHDSGDELLCQVTDRIKPLIRESDTLCRLGGDEFAMLLNDIDEEEIAHKASHLISMLAKPYLIGEHIVNISASIGIAIYPKHATKYEDLLKFADVSMYQAKDQGRNAFAFFESSMATDAQEQLTLDTALRQAIELEQFELYFQPQIELRTHQIIGFEALLRWTHPTFGSVSPDVFIPIAERSDLIVEITNWVLENALLKMHDFDKTQFKGCRMSVNISGRDFSQVEFIQRISTLLGKYPSIKASRLELELTERITMRSPQNTLKLLEELKLLDIRVAIDDFGTGYSSLNYLKTYPIDVIKIDKSFVEEILTNKKDFGVCETIVNLARALDMDVIAEGVETAEQNAILESLGCDFIQGYFYSKPKPFNELKSWVLNA